jgi:hypothetical protein
MASALVCLRKLLMEGVPRSHELPNKVRAGFCVSGEIRSRFW